ncbi:hypothetical protein COS54_02360 [Candidatus Shapirobacteria bacterium CG03_land_8_20_14_0_80_39_12]|uniref:TraC-like domain-containing protein n=1 Tax=Candidatus Shapirobacteria bacterium CG03_land_8_20_14_0_80_39_12 TaxID=1974879 RepID=A0A2M7BC90_9BACT|nr:MAG: hypothetical protein COS54_02360 [Candidatus Shapirobacteria bacterium CG03_land_8_20_14_0_80_39_12]
MDPAQIPIRASTQEYLPIEDIKNNLVVLKDGSCALVLSVSSVNFDLLSEREQEAIIYAYGALLNSLTFSIQIMIRSQRKDISSYLEILEKQEIKKTGSPLMVKLINSYRKFVADMVKKNNVLDKKFYVVIPFSALELGVAQTLTSIFRRNQGLPFPEDYILAKAQTALAPKKDHLIRLFARIGLVAKQLENKELIRLYYLIYNSEKSQKKETEVKKNEA